MRMDDPGQETGELEGPDRGRPLVSPPSPAASPIPVPTLDDDARRFEAIVESSDDAIISKTMDGTITSWNRAAERLFGYTADEILGKSISVLMPEERHDDMESILGRIRRGERVDHYETVRLSKTGRKIAVSLSVSPVKDALRPDRGRRQDRRATSAAGGKPRPSGSGSCGRRSRESSCATSFFRSRATSSERR